MGGHDFRSYGENTALSTAVAVKADPPQDRLSIADWSFAV